jgi:hypothetical protein
MNNIICVFYGGKKPQKSKQPKQPKPKKSTITSKSRQAQSTASVKLDNTKTTSSYCYQCNSMTMDKNAAFTNNIRNSACGNCKTKRSVFTN